MSKPSQKDLQTAGQEAGEAAGKRFVRALKRKKIDEDWVAKKLKQLSNWKEPKFFHHQGEIIETRKVKNANIILKTVAVVCDIYGAKAPEQVEHSGGVTILQPDPITKRDK